MDIPRCTPPPPPGDLGGTGGGGNGGDRTGGGEMAILDSTLETAALPSLRNK